MRKILLASALALFCAAGVAAQTTVNKSLYVSYNSALGTVIRPAAGAFITVCPSTATILANGTCTPTATIYTDYTLTVTKGNPVTVNSNGDYTYSAPTGVYPVTGTGSTIAPVSWFETLGAGTGGTTIPTYVTAANEVATLPNSRQLVASATTSLDTTTPGQIRVNVTGGGASGIVTLVATSPLTGGGVGSSVTVGIQQASGSQSGFLGSSDWANFNSKCPSGSVTTEVLFNNSGLCAGDSNLTWNNTAKTLTLLSNTGGIANAGVYVTNPNGSPGTISAGQVCPIKSSGPSPPWEPLTLLPLYSADTVVSGNTRRDVIECYAPDGAAEGNGVFENGSPVFKTMRLGEDDAEVFFIASNILGQQDLDQFIELTCQGTPFDAVGSSGYNFSGMIGGVGKGGGTIWMTPGNPTPPTWAFGVANQTINPPSGASCTYGSDQTGILKFGAATLSPLVVSTLPTASSNTGQLRTVSDSTSVAVEGQTCVGGSGNTALAFSNGAVWKCF